MDKCRTCPAKVLWAKHKKSGIPNPLDPEPVPEGNLLVSRDDSTGDCTYEVLTAADLGRAREHGIALYVSHFATCPNSRANRRKGKEKPVERSLFDLMEVRAQ